MSLEEVRDGESVNEVATSEIAEKPKTTRRRTVKKAESEDAAPAPKPVRTRAKAATKTAVSAEEPAVEAQPEKKPVRRRTTKKAEDSTVTLPLETVAPVVQAPETVPASAIKDKTETVAPAASITPTAVTSAPIESQQEVVSAQVQATNAPTPSISTDSSIPQEAVVDNQSDSTVQNNESSDPQFRGGEGTTAQNDVNGGVIAPQGDGFIAREEGFRNGRMSYRERRALRRNDRLQNRPPRLGSDGQPLPPVPYTPNSEIRGGETREPRPERFEGRGDRYERSEGRPERGERFEGRGDRYERQPRRRDLDLQSLEAMGDEELRALSAEMNVEITTAEGEQLDRATLVMALLEAQAQTQNATLKKGILDIINDNKAYLRCDGYHPGESDVYVSNTQIKRFNLKPGDMVLGSARAPKDNERYYGLLRVESVNGLPVEVIRYRRDFEKLTPIFPTERYVLETGPSNITARIIDLVSPVGKGQRGLIVAPPKAGKTTLIKSIANSITANYPDVKLFVLLIDERPEEVTDISRSVNGEVIASTFDETPDNHMRVADIVMERAKRLAEMKHDVVILMDSITRLSRASNLVVSPSGRTLSGGLDPAAMYKPKRMFGAARNLEEGGSLTILATALVDTGSRMDEMIFEEFKGTGNMDLVLDRDLFNQRIFPAIDINRSGTRRDDLLMSADELTATYHLRRTLAQLDNDKAVTLLIDRLKNTKSNSHFMEVVAKSARQQQNGTPTT